MPKTLKPETRRLVDLKTTAGTLGMSYESMRALVHRGELPVVRLPSGLARDGSARRLMVDLRDVDALIDRHKETLG